MDWRDFSKKLVLADGRIGAAEAKVLKRLMLTDGRIDGDEAAFLMEIKRAAREIHADFTAFLHDVLRRAILRDGAIGTDEVAWLRKMILDDRLADGPELELLKTLGREAKRVCPEFVQLLKDSEAAGLVTLTPA